MDTVGDSRATADPESGLKAVPAKDLRSRALAALEDVLAMLDRLPETSLAAAHVDHACEIIRSEIAQAN